MLGSVVKSKVGYLEKITREVRIRMVSKEVAGCFQAVAGKKKKFPVQFKNGQKKEIISSLLMFLSSKDEVDMDEPLSHSPKKEQG